MTTIRESGFILKIATGAAIGVTNPDSLDPADMSSGAASAGKVLTADGAGGIDWSAESGLGDVTGPAGGVADSDIAVFNGATGKVIKKPDGAVGFGGQQAANLDQSNLTPAAMSSGAATVGQLLTAGGGGATSWATRAPSINTPPSSTDHALARWNGTGGDTVQDSNVTLSDTDAMVFPAGGSISKPGAGAGSEVFGAGSTADAGSIGGTVVGPSSSLTNSIGGTAIGGAAQVDVDQGTALGFNAAVGTGCAAATALGYNATVHQTGSGDSAGAVAVGSGATVGALSGAGCQSAVCVGENTNAATGAVNAVCVGAGANSTATRGIAVGQTATVTALEAVAVGSNCQANGSQSVCIGPSSTIAEYNCVAIGFGIDTPSGSFYSTGVGSNCKPYAQRACAFGYGSAVYPVISGDSTGALAIGNESRVGDSTPGAGCDAAIAIGQGSSVAPGATNSVAIGPGAECEAPSCVAFGYLADTKTHQLCTAVGTGAICNGNSGSAVGYTANAGGLGVAVGHQAAATGTSYAVSVGAASDATQDQSTAIGGLSQAQTLYSVAVGGNAKVYAVSSGNSTGAIAIGRGSAVGNATPGAGCDAAICIGQGASVGVGHQNAVVIGQGGASTASNRVTFASTLEVEVGQGLAVWGVTPPGSQPAKINDPTGGATVDAEARSAIQSIIDALEGAGLTSST